MIYLLYLALRCDLILNMEQYSEWVGELGVKPVQTNKSWVVLILTDLFLNKNRLIRAICFKNHFHYCS